MGQSVGISKICRVEKFQNTTVRVYWSFVKEPAYAVSTTNMSFEGGSSLKLQKILAFFPCSQSRSFTGFLDKVTMKEVCRGPPAKRSRRSPTGVERLSVTDCTEKKHVSARQGERYGPEKQKAASRRGSNQELSVYVLPFETALFFKPAEVQRRTKFLNGVFCSCGLSDRSGGKEAERTTAKRQRWVLEWSTGMKQQSWAGSANARATPGWTASYIYKSFEKI